jgi:hypothetical protein
MYVCVCAYVSTYIYVCVCVCVCVYTLHTCKHTCIRERFCRHDRVLGGEWWVQRRDEKEDIGFHHDKDEALASTQATMKFPEVCMRRSYMYVRQGSRKGQVRELCVCVCMQE